MRRHFFFFFFFFFFAIASGERVLHLLEVEDRRQKSYSEPLEKNGAEAKTFTEHWLRLLLSSFKL